METTEIIGIAAGILTACSMLPQVIKTFREKKCEDVSIGMLIVLMCGLALWTFYGFRKNDLPIIVTNLFSILVNITMMVLRIRYKPSDDKKS